MIHVISRQQIIPAPRPAVWDYFRDPQNLNRLTPPDMNFEIVGGATLDMYEGQIIEYRVEFFRGIRSLWLTEISHVRPLEYFVDEQRLGPYRFWYHEHIFEDAPAGTKMTDRVHYEVPLGALGELLNQLWIAERLKQIFEFRSNTILTLFGDAS